MFAIFVLDGIGALLALGGSIIGCMGVCCTGQVVSDMFPRQLYSCFLVGYESSLHNVVLCQQTNLIIFSLFVCFFFVFIRRLQLLLWSPLEWRRRKWTKVHLPRNILRSLAINSFELYQERICPGWEDDRSWGGCFCSHKSFCSLRLFQFRCDFSDFIEGPTISPRRLSLGQLLIHSFCHSWRWRNIPFTLGSKFFYEHFHFFFANTSFLRIKRRFSFGANPMVNRLKIIFYPFHVWPSNVTLCT